MSPWFRPDAAALPLRTAAADAVVSGFALRDFADLASSAWRTRPRASARGETGLARSRRHRAIASSGLGHQIWFTHVVPRLGALFSERRGLPVPAAFGRLSAFLRREFAAMLDEAGFTDVNQHLLSGGIAQCVTATRSIDGGRS